MNTNCKRMDDSECLACQYLTHVGFRRIIFEPEGHTKFPDFLVEDRIAVEVTSLNEREVLGSKVVGLDDKVVGLDDYDCKLSNTIRESLRSLGPAKGHVSWYVNVDYRRPAPDKKRLRAAIRRKLEAFRNSSTQRPTTIQLFDNFLLTLSPAGQAHKDCFVLGTLNDKDAGVLVSSHLERNITTCLDEKTKKAENSGIPPAKYAEWWLVLIDRISYGEWKGIELLIPSSEWWDKVILVSPLDPTNAREIGKSAPGSPFPNA